MNMSKDIICHYASLNANSLVKSRSPETQSNYIRFLKSTKQYDILCFQETQARTPDLVQSLNVHFQPQYSHWTKHVGIVSLSANFKITLINTEHVYANDRFQLCRIDHPQQFYETFYILNIYAPAHSQPTRREFFDNLTTMLYEIFADNKVKNRKEIVLEN
ncbi:hypothetical protein G6F66_013350 [Rhizopus arrhizus]|nr:hypothetical protein G6F66_013350 [Rhizopus arrhizus]